jgi:hypothetical protein
LKKIDERKVLKELASKDVMVVRLQCAKHDAIECLYRAGIHVFFGVDT